MNDRYQQIATSISSIDTKSVSVDGILYTVIQTDERRLYLSEINSNHYTLLGKNIDIYDVSLSLDENYEINPGVFLLWYVDGTNVIVNEISVDNGTIQRTKTISYNYPVLSIDAVVSPNRVILLVVDINDEESKLVSRKYIDLFSDVIPDDIYVEWDDNNSKEFTISPNVRDTYNLAYTVDDNVYTARTLELFTVKFVDYNGQVLSEEIVIYGRDATPPADPTRQDYRFIGWDKAYTYITSDTTIQALYTLDMYMQIDYVNIVFYPLPATIEFDPHLYIASAPLFIKPLQIHPLTQTIVVDNINIDFNALDTEINVITRINTSSNNISFNSLDTSNYVDYNIDLFPTNISLTPINNTSAKVKFMFGTDIVNLDFGINDTTYSLTENININNVELELEPLPTTYNIDDGNLTIIEQPQDSYSCAGDIITFTIGVSGGKPPYHYRWVVNGSDAPYDADTVSFIAELNQNNMVVYCEVTDSVSTTIRSDYARVYVTECEEGCLTTYYMGGPYDLLCHAAGNGLNIFQQKELDDRQKRLEMAEEDDIINYS